MYINKYIVFVSFFNLNNAVIRKDMLINMVCVHIPEGHVNEYILYS